MIFFKCMKITECDIVHTEYYISLWTQKGLDLIRSYTFGICGDATSRIVPAGFDHERLDLRIVHVIPQWSHCIGLGGWRNGSALVFGTKSPKVEGSSPLLLATFLHFCRSVVLDVLRS